MSLRRRVVLVGGLLAAGVGIALAVQPSLPLALDLGDGTVSVLGVIALLYAGVPLYRRYANDRQPVRDPEPETTLSLPSPGEEVDEMLSVAAGVELTTAKQRLRLRRRLREAATAAIKQRQDCDTETASEMLEAGTWTDDVVAASFFTDGPVAVTPADVPLGEWIRLRLSAAARRAFAARRVADEIDATTHPTEDR